MAMTCTHMQEVSCHQCDGWAEVERLKLELTNAITRAESAESDLRHSDAIRAGMIESATLTAKDMLRCLELLEAAFHAGAKHEAQDSGGGMGGGWEKPSIDQAFREWTKENLNK